MDCIPVIKGEDSVRMFHLYAIEKTSDASESSYFTSNDASAFPKKFVVWFKIAMTIVELQYGQMCTFRHGDVPPASKYDIILASLEVSDGKKPSSTRGM
jgi:hypothetical protein